jgi:hypothetical protein
MVIVRLSTAGLRVRFPNLSSFHKKKILRYWITTQDIQPLHKKICETPKAKNELSQILLQHVFLQK